MVIFASPHTNIQITQTTANLADDIFVGESYDQSVFGRVILVTILNDESFPCIVVRLSLCECDSTNQLLIQSVP